VFLQVFSAVCLTDHTKAEILLISNCCTGFPRLLEFPGIFLVKFPRPGKSRKNEFGPGKSWNLLGDDADGGHSDVDA